jgi:hypothetical protein
MKAFLSALVAIAAISIGAWYAMNYYGQSTAEAFSSGNVRLDGQ